MSEETLKLVVKTIDNVSYDFEVPRDLPVTKLKERLKVSAEYKLKFL